MPPNFYHWGRPAPDTYHINLDASLSCVEPLEHHAGVGAAEAERVRQHAAELHVVAALPHDRHIGDGRIEILDIGAFADEARPHHQQGIDRLLRAGGAERVSGERFGRRYRRAFITKDLADRLDLLD